ncbi:MAG: ribonuclease R, partial [Lachnospiraceae bacterium]|nr:ribonuclease R [Lachnospiraceae bacterium]
MKKSRDERKKVILSLMDDKQYVPMKEKELAIILQVRPEDREELSSILEELMLAGKIEVNKRGRYSLIGQGEVTMKTGTDENVLIGTFISNQKGFGFVEVDGREEDIFIPEKNTGGAFHLDTVKVRLTADKRPAKSFGKATRNVGGRTVGKIVAVVERGTTQIVGTYEKSNKSFGFVIPDNNKLSSDIYIRSEDSMGAMDGHKVVVDMISYGDERHSPEGKITEILGHVNDPGVDIMSIVKGYGFSVEFPDAVMKQVEKVKETVDEDELQGREDLRNVLMV